MADTFPKRRTSKRRNLQGASAAKTPSAPAPGVTPNKAIASLLAEPEIRLLMQADRVDPDDLFQLLAQVAGAIRIEPATQSGEIDMNDEHYRTGVGIVLLNRRGEVFLGRRNDIRDAWQMPQGGVDLGEEPAHAALRELKEEIGTDRATIVAEASGWLRYDLPPDLVGKAWGGLWKGQRQKWFVMRFQGEDRDIDIATQHPEFDAWRWAPAHEVADRAAPFKRDVYKLVLSGFESFIAPMRD